MPWNWKATVRQDVSIGGGEGTVDEASSVKSWPNYDAAYLAKRLGAKEPQLAYDNRFDAGKLGNWQDEAARQVYLDKISSNFREEADECLKAEFLQWLQGTHEDNLNPREYLNNPGQQARRAIHPVVEQDANGQRVVRQAGEMLTNWRPTWWNTNQLTHLDGVRDFLREKKTREEEHEFALNLLAEYGPNNIDQAWTYFKCWVKGRPVRPEECAPVRDRTAVTDDGTLKTTKRSGPTWMAESRSDILRSQPPPSAPANAAAAVDDALNARANDLFAAMANDGAKASDAAQVNAAINAAAAPTDRQIAEEVKDMVVDGGAPFRPKEPLAYGARLDRPDQPGRSYTGFDDSLFGRDFSDPRNDATRPLLPEEEERKKAAQVIHSHVKKSARVRRPPSNRTPGPSLTSNLAAPGNFARSDTTPGIPMDPLLTQSASGFRPEGGIPSDRVSLFRARPSDDRGYKSVRGRLTRPTPGEPAPQFPRL